MWGQWLGTFDGTNTGNVILNVDKDRLRFGRISIYDRTTDTPARWANVFFTENNGQLTGSFQYLEEAPPIPGISHAAYGDLVFNKISDTFLSGTWTTNVGTNGEFTLKKADEDIPTSSDYVFTWPELINWLQHDSQKQSQLLFRGQRNSTWRLKTTFHRTGRFDLMRYDQEDVLRLNHNLASLLNKVFDLKNPVEYGALLNLAQHHGFPTPLLDWTESPYIGAFFAFSELPKDETDGYARLFTLNLGQWLEDHRPVMSLLEQKEYFSPHYLPALYNPRAFPQQSVVTSTNINDIESWFDLITPSNKKYLIKIDIAKTERSLVMHELSKMGITCASLFPGVEGSCRALKERYF